MMTSIIDIAWLAGLLEGEGCFMGPYPQIIVSSTDKDVVDRLAKITDSKVYGPVKTTHKDQYRVTICGTRAIEWMETIYSLMGIRRKSKIKSIIESKYWRNKYPRRGSEPYIKPRCVNHPDREHIAHHLCWACYQRQRRRNI
jgi:hypothetical protein